MIYRPRRLRKTESIRQLVRETELTVNDLIYPLFVLPGNGKKEEIASMQGQYRFSVDRLEDELEKVYSLGIKSVLFFGLADYKDDNASDAYNHNGAVQNAVRMAREKFPNLYIITDVCVCAFTDHGHCGILHEGYVQNDESLQVLAKTAVSHARAGAHMVAPSAMMDGQVQAIREALDEHGFGDTPIMSYSAKYLSACYGPFRDAANSAPKSGNRASYQMDPANSREALLEMELDVEERADILMVKPALMYLDILQQAKERFSLPLAAYNVSGEYSMVKAGAEKGWIDEKAVVMEMLTSIKRAGANMIITYFAKDVAQWLKK